MESSGVEHIKVKPIAQVSFRSLGDSSVNPETARFSSAESCHTPTSVRTFRVHSAISNAQCKLRGVLAWASLHKQIVIEGTSTELRCNSSTLCSSAFLRNYSTLQHLPQRHRLILPESKLLKKWNMLMLVLLVYSLIATPWIMAFEEGGLNNPLVWTDLFVDCMFLSDVLVTLNSAYVYKEHLVTSRLQIFLNYAKGLLLVDLLSSFPFYLYETGSATLVIRGMRIAKLARLFKASKLLQIVKTDSRLGKFLESHEGVSRLLLIVLSILLMAHLTACSWFFIAKTEDFGPETWVFRHGFIDSSQGQLYLASVYWAFTILTTVGFGDIHAYSRSEMVLCIMWMLFGIGFYSFLIGTLTSVLGSIDASQSVVKQALDEVEEFGQELQLNKRVLDKVKKEVETRERLGTLDKVKRIALLAGMSKELQHKICMNMHGEAATFIPLLREQDAVFINYVVPRLDYVSMAGQTFVYRRHEYAEGVYFIVEGRVDYVLSQNNIPFKSMVQGGYFGEIELFERSPRLFSVMTSQSCKFLVMDRGLFNEALAKFVNFAKTLEETAVEKKQRDALSMTDVLDYLEMIAFKTDSIVEPFSEQFYKRRSSYQLTNTAIQRHNLESSIRTELDSVKSTIVGLSSLLRENSQ